MQLSSQVFTISAPLGEPAAVPGDVVVAALLAVHDKLLHLGPWSGRVVVDADGDSWGSQMVAAGQPFSLRWAGHPVGTVPTAGLAR